MRPGALILAALASIVGWVAIGLLAWVVVMLAGCAGRNCVRIADAETYSSVCRNCHESGGSIEPREHDLLVLWFSQAATMRVCNE
jgi:hypothetical protein